MTTHRFAHGWVLLALLTLLGLLLAGCASAERHSDRELPGAERVYALVNAHLIPIAVPGVVAHQTLIVAQGRIQAIGSADQIQIPPKAEVIDLRGRYVLPGFVDMHVHLADERDLLLFLRHGVTTVRNMAAYPWWTTLLGSVDPLVLRQKVKAGELLGPDIFTCGPMLEGEPAQNLLTRVIDTPAQAEAAVREIANAGYDCVKVYNHLGKPAFEAVIRAAWLHDLPVMGHVPYDLGLDGALKAGMRTIEHLNPYIDNFA
ncbi:MAG: hypothetical protein CVV27_10545, partial [Candidatus Melainabacteria bacterium HGW-Melainabacteria-1]